MMIWSPALPCMVTPSFGATSVPLCLLGRQSPSPRARPALAALCTGLAGAGQHRATQQVDEHPGLALAGGGRERPRPAPPVALVGVVLVATGPGSARAARDRQPAIVTVDDDPPTVGVRSAAPTQRARS
jgi:hypothetical protein